MKAYVLNIAERCVNMTTISLRMDDEMKKELDEIIVRCRITKDDLYMEAECVEEYGEWIHMSLMG